MGSYFYFRSPIQSDEHNLGSIADTVSLEVDSMVSKDVVPDIARTEQMVMESTTQKNDQESKKIKKSTIDSKKASKKKHSTINSVKEYDKQKPEPNSPTIEKIMSIKKKSLAEDKDYER